MAQQPKQPTNAIIGEDDRLRRSEGENRQTRAVEDYPRTQEDGTALSRDERLALLRNEFQQEALPTPPQIPGYHMVWLTTNSSYDPIHKRIRIGYELVKAEEIAGFELYKMNSGDYNGYITCNEMILAKIPNDIYQMIMEEFHHNQPLAEEKRIKEQLTQGTSDGRAEANLEEGFKDLGRVVRPVFD